MRERSVRVHVPENEMLLLVGRKMRQSSLSPRGIHFRFVRPVLCKWLSLAEAAHTPAPLISDNLSHPLSTGAIDSAASTLRHENVLVLDTEFKNL